VHSIFARLLSGMLLTAAIASGASAREPSFPGWPYATFPSVIILVGHDGAGNADPLGEFAITVMDIAGDPLENVSVVLDFTACTDLRIANAQLVAGESVECTASGAKVTMYTAADGVARFRIVGGALNTGSPEGAGMLAVPVVVADVSVGDITAATVDQAGLDGVSGNDGSLLEADYFNAAEVGRSDLDGNGALGANDWSILSQAYFDNHSRYGAASLPGGVCP
jgi:hypothetical protein